MSTMKIVILLMLSCLISASAFAADATLDNQGHLTIPELQIKGGSAFSATLTNASNAVFPPVYALTSLVPLGRTLVNPTSIYYPSEKGAEINGVLINGSRFNIQLTKKDTGGFELTRMQRSSLASIWFLVTPKSSSYKSSGIYDGRLVGNHFVMDASSAIKLFSDRPFRIAQPFRGGLTAFAQSYNTSDFVVGASEYPNVVFVGTNKTTGQEVTSIFDVKDVFVSQNNFIISVDKAIGTSQLPAVGDYANTSFVIDSLWSDISDTFTGVVHTVGNTIKTTVVQTVDGVTSIISGGGNVLDGIVQGAGNTAGTMSDALYSLCTQSLGGSITAAFASSTECSVVAKTFSAYCLADTSVLEISTDGASTALCALGQTVVQQACNGGATYFIQMNGADAYSMQICNLLKF